MKITKLNNRWKLFKQGKAQYMVEITASYFSPAERILVAAYGMGASVPKWSRIIPINRDWYYSYEKKTITHMTQIGKEVNGTPIINIHRENKYWYRIYFRREEQATYFALAMNV